MKNMIKKLFSFSHYPEFLRLAWWRIVVPKQMRNVVVELGKGVAFLGSPIISMAKGSSIHIEDGAMLTSTSQFTALGVNHPVILRTLRPGAKIEIGNDVGMSGVTICAAQSVRIGKQCLFGANVLIADTDFHALAPQGRRYNNHEADIATAPIIIGENVFIGTGSIILKGVEIGENSVIGAGSVVSKSVPANVIAAGNPAGFDQFKYKFHK